MTWSCSLHVLSAPQAPPARLPLQPTPHHLNPAAANWPGALASAEMLLFGVIHRRHLAPYLSAGGGPRTPGPKRACSVGREFLKTPPLRSGRWALSSASLHGGDAANSSHALAIKAKLTLPLPPATTRSNPQRRIGWHPATARNKATCLRHVGIDRNAASSCQYLAGGSSSEISMSHENRRICFLYEAVPAHLQDASSRRYRLLCCLWLWRGGYSRPHQSERLTFELAAGPPTRSKCAVENDSGHSATGFQYLMLPRFR